MDAPHARGLRLPVRHPDGRQDQGRRPQRRLRRDHPPGRRCGPDDRRAGRRRRRRPRRLRLRAERLSTGIPERVRSGRRRRAGSLRRERRHSIDLRPGGCAPHREVRFAGTQRSRRPVVNGILVAGIDAKGDRGQHESVGLRNAQECVGDGPGQQPGLPGGPQRPERARRADRDVRRSRPTPERLATGRGCDR